MSDVDTSITRFLPLLPLSTGVVLPQMVVPLGLESDEAKAFADALRGIADAGTLADTAGYSPDLSFEQRIELLETIDVTERLAKALAWARDTLGELELKERIRSDVSDGMEKRQREFMLRQQMDAIRKELGEDADDVAGGYRARLADLQMPLAVREAVEREIDRLERTGEQSPEPSRIRTWLDTLTELPWGKRSDDRLDLTEARAILDADHTGLDDVKERIVEHLAVRKLRKERGLDETPEDTTVPARGGSGAILVL